MKSNEYLKNCIDMFSIADHITDDAKIEMFITYAKMVLQESKAQDISSSAVLAVSLPSLSEILIKSKEYESGSEMNDRYRRIGFQDGMQTMKTIVELQLKARQ